MTVVIIIVMILMSTVINYELSITREDSNTATEKIQEITEDLQSTFWSTFLIKKLFLETFSCCDSYYIGEDKLYLRKIFSVWYKNIRYDTTTI